MKCPICKYGETAHGSANVKLERDGTMVIFKQVPAEICGNCGETFHSDKITASLLKQANAALRAGVEFDMRRFATLAHAH
jgi:YgiT-type zinc finger domain-containing protein